MVFNINSFYLLFFFSSGFFIKNTIDKYKIKISFSKDFLYYITIFVSWADE